MLYQALIGAWPLGGDRRRLRRRIEDYAIKAAREGKLETSWLNPNEDYEKGLRDFVRAILDRNRVRPVPRIRLRRLRAAPRCSAR